MMCVCVCGIVAAAAFRNGSESMNMYPRSRPFEQRPNLYTHMQRTRLTTHVYILHGVVVVAHLWLACSIRTKSLFGTAA